jgi:hypothetical protein
MPQASCCQARRQAKQGAQQSSDCEHPSKLGNAAWRHDAPFHRLVGRRAGSSGTRAFSFASVFFHVKENEETIYERALRIGKTSPGPPPEVVGLDQN